MDELKSFDNIVDLDEDSYETPSKLKARMAKNYGLDFQLDAAATAENKLCEHYLDDALHQEWVIDPGNHVIIVDVWCNPPHSITEEMVRRADEQHKKWNMNICMIVPTNCQSARFWQDLIENEKMCFVENHPVAGRPHFLKHGRKTKHGSRNAYRSIIWRKKTSIVTSLGSYEGPTPYN